MKRIKLLLALVASFALFGAQNIYAQSKPQDIDWSKHAQKIEDVLTANINNVEKKYVFLYNKTNGSFLTVGADYGAQGILNDVGMRFFINQTGKKQEGLIWLTGKYSFEKPYYNIHSNITDSGNGDNADRMAYETFDSNHGEYSSVWFDRGRNGENQNRPSYPDWFIIEQGSNVPTYKFCNLKKRTNNNITDITSENDIKNDGQSLAYDKNAKGIKRVTYEKGDEWYIISESDYVEQMSKLEDEYVDMSFLLADSRFNRNEKDEQTAWGGYWEYHQGSNDGFHKIGIDEDAVKQSDTQYGWNFYKKYGSYYSAEINNQEGYYYQTVKGLPAGTYVITCQNFYDGEGDNNCAYLFAGNSYDTDNKVALNTLSDSQRKRWNDYYNSTIDYVTGSVVNSQLKENGEQGFGNLAAAQLFAENTSMLVSEVTVTINEGDDLVLGFSNKCGNNAAYADNFKLYYTPKTVKQKEYAIYISANNTNNKEIDRKAYTNIHDLYLRRSFELNKWNAIVLPVSLTTGQLQQAFGTDMKLSKLTGINPERPSQIKFEPVVFSENGKLEAGECYVIKVTREPQITDNTNPTTIEVWNGEYEANGKIKTVVEKDVYGPLYVIPAVSRTEEEAGAIPDNGIVTRTYTTGKNNEYNLNFTGYYYKPKTEGKDTPWAAHTYFVDGGNMYYLDEPWGTIYGTIWYLEDVDNSAGAKPMSIEINGVVDNTTTDISGAVFGNAYVTNHTVYTIDGRAVGKGETVIESLPKGLYVIDGKKFIKK